MSNKNQQEVSNFLYPPLRKVIDNQNSDVQESPISLEAIYFDPNVLCCPFCGTTNLSKGGFEKGKRAYYCKRIGCKARFIDPKLRTIPPKKRPPKLDDDKYVDKNILCCPSCGNTDLRKTGSGHGNKQSYLCKRSECGRRFLDPRLRKSKVIEGVNCRFCNSSRCSKHKIRHKKQSYKCLDCKKTFVLDATKPETPKLDENSEDVWDAKSLGIKNIPAGRSHKFNFAYIKQSWLKEAFKRFVRIQTVYKSHSSIRGYFTGINKFSDFLFDLYPNVSQVNEIDRSIIIEYISHLSHQELKEHTFNTSLGVLKTFFDIGNRHQIFKVEAYLVIPEKDYLNIPRPIPRYIPSNVLKQLNKYLDKLPEQVARMVIVIQECGMRYSELSNIKFNCLVSVGDKWSVNFYDFKLKQYRTLPISLDCMNIIKEQQKFIQSYFGNENKYLFTSKSKESCGTPYFLPAKNRVMTLDSFTYYLNKLAQEYEIKDDNGQLWQFASHQFRHTVGTEAIQNGVPFHIVMKMLGHSSPEMTLRYAHIHDETLRKELMKFHENRIVDITGQTVSLELEGDEQTLEWFTKEICAIALPNGYCGRPKRLGDCDIPGDIGCYLCPHFRTNKTFLTIHKEQLAEIEKVLLKARKYNWQLPIKKNEPIKENLMLIISNLESDADES